MFYVAYTIPSRGRPRPVTFLFNGGPGSSTMWLHMGSFGPMKVDASIPETIAGPPFRYGANPDTLLDITDLVFIDAPTTGLSRAARQGRDQGLLRRRQGPRRLHPDHPALADQVRPLEQPEVHHRRELRHDARGGARPIRCSNAGVQLNGIAFVSTVFNFADFQGDQSLINFLPTYAADAWYHGKIADKPPLETLPRSRRATSPAALMRSALQKGDALSDEEKQSVAQQMAQLTGLSADYILRSQPARAAQPLPARAAARPPPGHRANRFALSSAPSPTLAARAPITIRRAARSPAAFVGGAQRLSVPRPRLQDAAHLSAQQLRRDPAATTGASRTSRPTGGSRSPTPASISPTRCARTRG